MCDIPKRGKLEGHTFHYLTVFKDICRTSNGTIIYQCICKCGNITKANANSLRQGVIKSCRCWMKENARNLFQTHGMRGTRIYKIWAGIIQRCDNPKNTSYERYGAKGIKVCERWYSFEAFYEDMKEGYQAHLTIDRIDSKKHYEKANCKWSTCKEQSDNRSTTIFLTIDGVTKKLMEWSLVSGVNSKIIRQRVKTYKWSHKEAVYGKQ